MRILLCHERFVFRYGVDKVLLLLAREFTEMGHQVVLAGFQHDSARVPKGVNVVAIPRPDDYLQSDAHFSDWLANHWDAVERAAGGAIDVAMSAGWPAFSSLAVFRAKGCVSIFNDHGVVPDFGYPPEMARTLGYLRLLKSIFVGVADGVATVSQFLHDSQGRSFVGHPGLVRVILNGDSHVSPAATAPSPQCDFLVLGRFETGCYKQSELVFQLAGQLQANGWSGRIGILAKPEEVSLPEPVASMIVPLGHPADAELSAWIISSRACLSFSSWEGFNLPLAEAQRLGTPCLVFDVGAHPEVVANKSYLCRDVGEMVEKCLFLAAGKALPENPSGNNFPGRGWQKVAEEYQNLFHEAAESAKSRSGPARRNNLDSLVLYDCSNACLDDNNSGVVRVSRRLAAQLQRWFPVAFILFDKTESAYRLPNTFEWTKLSAYGGPSPEALPHSYDLSNPPSIAAFVTQSGLAPAIAVLPEIRHGSEMIEFKELGERFSIPLAGIFYDAIPILRPEFVTHDKYRVGHAEYMKDLLGFDMVISISRFSQRCLEEFRVSSGAHLPQFLSSVPLPGGDRPQTTRQFDAAKRPFALCVSTFEPRKNHRRLIAAFQRARTNIPEDFELHLVGGRYAGAEDLFEHIESAAQGESRIVLCGVLTDDELSARYEQCAFTIYPSEIEGFGLPILESLQSGKPCITHAGGVMGEVASGGGCLTVNALDEAAIAEAIVELANNPSRLDELASQARARPVKTWAIYGAEMASMFALALKTKMPSARIENSMDELFFRGCWLEQWQMSDSERIALSGVLQTLKPKVAIEVGTFKAGSLSLIAQHSGWTFSIDIDAEIPLKYGHFERVSFLTGPSSELLPLLLDRLAVDDAWPEFILIDGDHSCEGARLDLNAVLKRRPRRRTTVLLHDAANIECRRGMTSADWSACPYVEYADLDFVPGRIVEQASAFDGQVWGGLALIILSPEPRAAALAPRTSASRMIQHLRAYSGSGG